MTLRLLAYPDPRLRAVAEPVTQYLAPPSGEPETVAAARELLARETLESVYLAAHPRADRFWQSRYADGPFEARADALIAAATSRSFRHDSADSRLTAFAATSLSKRRAWESA